MADGDRALGKVAHPIPITVAGYAVFLRQARIGDPDVALLQPKSMRQVRLSDLLPKYQLLPDAMLGSVGLSRKTSVRMRLDEGVPAANLHMGIKVVVDSRPQQQLLPLLAHPLAAPLPVEMQAPGALADRVIAKVHVPGMKVRVRNSIRLLRLQRRPHQA